MRCTFCKDMNKSGGNTMGILVFARSSSARLPGKVLLDFAGMPLVIWILQRAMSINPPLSLACSSERSDDELASVVQSAGFQVYRGALDDVLARAISACEHFCWTHFARLCADRPFFNLEEIRTGLAHAKLQPTFDLISNNLAGAAPTGLTTEIIRRDALKRIAELSTLAKHREHLSSYFYDHPSAFQSLPLTVTQLPASIAAQYFAVDTPADYQRLHELAAGCSPNVGLTALLQQKAPDYSHAG